MADKTWKVNERDFAKFFADKLKTDVRRNDAVFRAGDKRRNSDVDVVHPRLRIYRGSILSYRGITGELKYSSSGHTTLYKWLKEETNTAALKKRGKGRFTVLVINKAFIAFWLDDFFYAYDCFVKGAYKNYQIAMYANVIHKQSGYEFKGLDSAASQAARYAHELNLFPVPCIRLKGNKQVAIFRISDIEASMQPKDLGEYSGQALKVDKEVEDDSPEPKSDIVQDYLSEIEKATASVAGKPTTATLRLRALGGIARVRDSFAGKGIPLPNVSVSGPRAKTINITVSKEYSVETTKSPKKVKRTRRAAKDGRFICPYCKGEFKSAQALGGHIGHCKER